MKITSLLNFKQTTVDCTYLLISKWHCMWSQCGRYGRDMVALMATIWAPNQMVCDGLAPHQEEMQYPYNDSSLKLGEISFFFPHCFT